MSVFTKQEYKNIDSILKKVNKNSELEFSILKRDNIQKKNISLSYYNFLNIIKYINNDSKNIIYKQQIFDMCCFNEKKELYRISIEDIDKINDVIITLNQNNDETFDILKNKYDNKNISFIKKAKKAVLDIEDYPVRFREANENDVSKTELNNLNMVNSIYRFKNRIRYRIYEDKFVTLYVDASIVKINNTIQNISDKARHYEVELEVEINKYDKSIITSIEKSIYKLLQLSNYNENIISITETNQIIESYCKLLNINMNNNKLFYSMPLKSLTLQDCINGFDNYNITDKADGERMLIYIYNSTLYGITKTFNIVTFDIEYNKKVISSYNNTIIDGEYIYDINHKKHIFLAFDILVNSGKNCMQMLLYNRLEQLYEIETKLFNINSIFDKSKKITKLEEALKYYDNTIDNYINILNNRIEKTKASCVFKCKYFINLFNINKSEIYNYIVLINNKYNTMNNYPYTLDGVILNSIIDIYSNKVELIKNLNIKWKPENLNTIDFYLNIKKNKMDMSDVIVFDGTISEDAQYKIGYLHVGNKRKDGNNKEEPVLFKKNLQKHLINLVLDKDGLMRDINGDIVLDNTVIECSYNFANDIDEAFRWSVLKTRYDKTENVQKYGINYGNYKDIADNIWKSMENPVTKQDIENLSNFQNYKIVLHNLMVLHEVKIKKEDSNDVAYYQKNTNDGKSLRSFHNWIKSLLINNYCSNQEYLVCKKDCNKNKKTVLDIGCGRGGDLLKFISADVGFVIGMDKDISGLDSLNGVKDRYNKLKSKMKNIPEMEFIHGDFTQIFTVKEQNKSTNSTSKDNDRLIRKYINKYKTKFDVLNIQFVFHYLFNSEPEFNSVCNNINNVLNVGGYLLMTCFDGDTIKNLLDKNNNSYIVNNVDSENNINKLFEIKYNKALSSDFCSKIDFYSFIMFNANQYQTECLLFKDQIIKLLKEKCNLHLVETEMFSDVYDNNIDLIKEKYTKEPNNINLKNIIELSDENSINKACYEFNKLYRYYVFVKK